jgi:hypothetical protein
VTAVNEKMIATTRNLAAERLIRFESTALL